jgi:hypothetical protein
VDKWKLYVILFATIQSNEPRINAGSISPLCLFLTCRGENLFLDVQYNKLYMIINACVVLYKCKITLLHRMVALCTRKQTFALAGRMLRDNCIIVSPLDWSPLFPFSPLPATHANIYHHQQYQHAQIFFCWAHLYF